MVNNPVEVMDVAVDGTRNILNLARRSKSVVFLSSMEVYGQVEKSEVYEDDLGYIDLSIPRSSYPESKRFCEALCTAYYKQYGIPER
jgi:nucleoside-diphosphate-sugar epimerase